MDRSTWLPVAAKVEIIDDFNGRETHVCWGVVIRRTKNLVVVMNEHGNTDRFRLRDGRCVRYSWPTLTHAIRRV